MLLKSLLILLLKDLGVAIIIAHQCWTLFFQCFVMLGSLCVLA